MIVMKFGGTSLGNADRISDVANIIKSNIGKKPVVVVSAVGGITDKLIELANAYAQEKDNNILDDIKQTHHEIIGKFGLDKTLVDKDLEELSKTIDEIKIKKKLNNKLLDKVQSFGEQMSTKILAAHLAKLDVKAQAFNAWDLGFTTNDDFGNAEPLEATYLNLKKSIESLDIIPIITGFMGKTESGEIATLGRGGSDYTAAIIGSAIGANEIQIWTDVDGILSADPKIVGNAQSIESISFAEASELAYFGARVLHPKTIIPAMEKDIPVRVLNTLNPQNNGTLILNESVKNGRVVKSISCKKDIILINIGSTRMLGTYGFLAKLFTIFDKYHKSIDVISTSEVNVSLTVDNKDNLDKITKELSEIANVRSLNNQSIICVVGEGMRHMPGISGRTFTALGKGNINIEMVSQGASEINITFVVDGKDADNAVRALHEEYFTD